MRVQPGDWVDADGDSVLVSHSRLDPAWIVAPLGDDQLRIAPG